MKTIEYFVETNYGREYIMSSRSSSIYTCINYKKRGVEVSAMLPTGNSYRLFINESGELVSLVTADKFLEEQGFVSVYSAVRDENTNNVIVRAKQFVPSKCTRFRLLNITADVEYNAEGYPESACVEATLMED